MSNNKSLRIIKKLWIKNHYPMIKTKSEYKDYCRMQFDANASINKV